MKLVNERGWSDSELARQMGISRAEANRFMKGQRCGGKKLMSGLLRAFPNETIETLFILPTLSSPISNRKAENCPGELDKPIACGDDGNAVFIEVADETADILVILEDQEQLSALISALDRLASDDRELWNCLVNKVKKQEIADRFNLTLDGVYYREKRLKSILRADATLKTFYEKD